MMKESAARPVLVLGAKGQVGRATLASLARAACPAVGLDHGQIDIVDQAQVEGALARWRPAVVINAAAYTAVDAAEADSQKAFAVNGFAPGLIARAACASGAALIHLSTDYVFDGAKGQPYVEDDLTHPLSVYGRSKLVGEQAVLQAEGKGIVLRTSWLLGPQSGFVRAVLNHAERGEPLNVVADQMGRPTMVEDLAEALAALARSDALMGDARVYHYAGASDATWHDVARELTEAWATRTGGRPPPLAAIATADWKAAARRPADSRLDSARLAKDFGLAGRDWRGAAPGLVEAWLRGDDR